MASRPTKTPFQKVTDDLTGGCGCACHTGTGYRTSCEHCSPVSTPHSELAEAMERANDSWAGGPYPVGPGVSQEFARAVQDRTTLAAEVSRLVEQLEAAQREIARLKSDRGMWHHDPNPASRQNG